MISIIIPVYRSEQTLERCINSICEQTYQDWEAIMIVDGPPDASGILADKLSESDARIRVIHQENQGVSVARNVGIEAAKGCYIAFLDSDDYLEKNALKSMIQAMEPPDGLECDLVIAGFHHIFFGKDIVKVPSMQGVYDLQNAEQVFLNLYGEQFLNMPWNKLYKKALIQQGFPLHMNLGEDLCFNLQYMEQIRFLHVIQEPICNYIQDDRGTTLSTRRREDRIETALTLYHTVLDFCERYFISTSAERKKVLLSKVAVEFLDACENLTFEIPNDRKGREEELKKFKKAWSSIAGNEKPELKLLDYKIIYFWFSKGNLKVTDFMIWLRGIVVKMVRKK